MGKPKFIDGVQQIDSGSPAFPVSVPGAGDNGWHGMCLRDYFAGQMIAGGMARAQVPDYELGALFGRNATGITREMIIAADAYRLADAMLALRAES